MLQEPVTESAILRQKQERCGFDEFHKGAFFLRKKAVDGSGLGYVHPVSAAAQSSQKPSYRIRIQHLFDQVLDQRLLYGAVIAILHDEMEEIFTIGTGLTEDTLLELGSVSKVFTALLLAVMLERGLIRIEDTVYQYLPHEFQARRSDRPLRIRDLAFHRSGLPAQPSNAGRMRFHVHDPFAGYGVQDLMAELARFDLQRPINPQYGYSNLGFALLGYSMEKAGGAPFAQLMKTMVLEPLGLLGTCIEATPSDETMFAQGHTQLGQNALRWRSVVMAPCGGICSTAADCGRFLQFFLGKPNPLSGAISRMIEPQPEFTADRFLGWKQKAGDGWLWHNGVTGGFTAYLGLHPKKKLGVAILTNRFAVDLVTELGARTRSILMDDEPGPMSGDYGLMKAYAIQGLIDFSESPLWLRAGLAGLATGMLSWFLH